MITSFWNSRNYIVTSMRRTPEIVKPQTGSLLLEAVVNLTDPRAAPGQLGQLRGLAQELSSRLFSIEETAEWNFTD
jgi:hypothetical protein